MVRGAGGVFQRIVQVKGGGAYEYITFHAL